MYNQNSKLKEIYESPVGKDILNKLLLQLNLSSSALTNPLIGNLKVKALKKMAGQKLGEGFWDTFLRILNSEPDVPISGDCEIQKAWWKEAVFYQIYPRSFCDSNDDGMGDLPGIISKLDYLKALGVDALWLSPIYKSPQDDNGYDISDYRDIYEQFGTLQDFDTLLSETHARGMKLIMDLVVNHSSDEHAWFKQAIADPESDYHDYYIFRKGSPDELPNNWNSFFSGSAWNYYPENGEWGLHLFSKKQMDLNWDNPKLRAEIIDMIKWWLQKGVDGFRMDVINVISKPEGLPDGDDMIGEMMGIRGIEQYFYGPNLHKYLRQIRAEAFDPFDAFSVGETPGLGMEMGKLITGDDRHELDMFFCFDHLENAGHSKFDDYCYDLNELKRFYVNWQENFGNHCWQALFLENHDNPRFVSKVDPNPAFHEKLAMTLLCMQLTLRGTPFIYQGQEMGLGNIDFHGMDEIQDVESKNLYQELLLKMSEEDAFKVILAGTRDHARQMIDWENSDPKELLRRGNVQDFVRNLTALRKKYKCLVYGKTEFTNIKKKDLLTYYRRSDEDLWYVEMNLSNHEVNRTKVDITCEQRKANRVLGNYEKPIDQVLRPYEVNVYHL